MSRILYITGRGGNLQTGLAEHLMTITDDFVGIAVDAPFLKQEPAVQIQVIQDKIRADTGRLVIANSYGAYLTLLALIDLEVIPEKILLLSPVLGTAKAKDRMYYSRPPFAKRLELAYLDDTLKRPKLMKVVMGDQDELYSSEQIDTINNYFGANTAQILAGQEHMLTAEAVQHFVSLMMK